MSLGVAVELAVKLLVFFLSLVAFAARMLCFLALDPAPLGLDALTARAGEHQADPEQEHGAGDGADEEERGGVVDAQGLPKQRYGSYSCSSTSGPGRTQPPRAVGPGQ